MMGRGTLYFLVYSTPWWINAKGQLIVQDAHLHAEDKDVWSADEDVFPLGLVCAVGSTSMVERLVLNPVFNLLKKLELQVAACNFTQLIPPEMQDDVVAILVGGLDVPARWVFLAKNAFQDEGAEPGDKCYPLSDTDIKINIRPVNFNRLSQTHWLKKFTEAGHEDHKFYSKFVCILRVFLIFIMIPHTCLIIVCFSKVLSMHEIILKSRK
jgi:hypothetical protein